MNHGDPKGGSLMRLRGLQAKVRRQSADRVLDDFELARFECQPVQHDRPVDDPADREQAEGRTACRCADDQRHGHAVDADCDDCRGNEAGQSRHPGGFAEHANHDQKDDDRNGCRQSRQRKAVRDRKVLLLPHSEFSPFLLFVRCWRVRAPDFRRSRSR